MSKAKKIVESEEAKEGSIPGLTELSKEFKTGKMPERKLVALRTKLVSLFLDGKHTEDEQDLMEAILRKERNLGKINSRDQYLLNKIESDRSDNKCIVKTDDAPTVHHLSKDLECKYEYDSEYNDGKGKKDSVGRYHVYVPRTIPTRHQLKVETVMKEMLGHPTDEKDYPLPKVVIHRLILKGFEFERWFEVEDNELLAPKQTEVSYQF